MIVYIFGNPDLDIDSLPLKLLPFLQQEFSEIDFRVQDPNEEWLFQDQIIVLDTVLGINQISLITDLSTIHPSPRLTMHDFDAGTYLKYLQKLGKLKKITIIGIPSNINQTEALTQLKTIFNASQF